jgi:hypothetical protein
VQPASKSSSPSTEEIYIVAGKQFGICKNYDDQPTQKKPDSDKPTPAPTARNL